MTVSFKPAVRENVPLLIGVAGGTGSGKTMSALRLARGIADGQPFAFIDTENGRALHYADQFPEMQHGELKAPYRPERYIEAIMDGFAHLKDVPKEKRVVVIDSFSHEWAGDGGCLDWADEITGGDPKKNPQAWAKVKPAHRKMMTKLLALPAHLIVCLRAEHGKMDVVRVDGQTKFVPKQTLPGGSLDGWTPLTEKSFPFEITASFLVVSDAPGVPRPLKLEGQHASMVPLDQPLSEQVGRSLAGWAAGASASPSEAGQPGGTGGSASSGNAGKGLADSAAEPGSSTTTPRKPDGEADEPAALEAELLAWADAHNRPDVAQAVGLKRAALGGTAQHLTWLKRQVAKIKVPA